jgi:hypothetical protein
MKWLDGATVAIQPSSETEPYSWEELYRAAVLEPDDALLEQRIEVAEGALLTRWLELTNRHEHRVEIQAIVNATLALRDLKRERLRKRPAA